MVTASDRLSPSGSSVMFSTSSTSDFSVAPAEAIASRGLSEPSVSTSITRRSYSVDCSTRVGSTEKDTRRTGAKMASIGITPMVAVVRPGRGQVALAAVDRQVDRETTLGVDRGDVLVGVEDLDASYDLDVGRGDLLGPGRLETDRHRLLELRIENHVLQVQDDVGDVLDDPGDGVELVEGFVEADLGDRGAGDGRQQGAAKRVAERVTEAGLERGDREPLAVLGLLIDGFDGRALDDEHFAGTSVTVTGWTMTVTVTVLVDLLGVELDDE